MDNLDSFLFPKDSPYAQNRGAISAYDFNSDYERSLVYNSLIQDKAITNAKIGTAAIGSANIQDLAVTSSKIVSLDASKINAGTIVVALNLGTSASGSLILDGANNRFIVHDGTTNRIVIGNI